MLSKTILEKIYTERFNETSAYRLKVWVILNRYFFSKYIDKKSTVLDLGAGYGEFINTVDASKKYAMDLNPETMAHLLPKVNGLSQDCSQPWKIGEPLDVGFSSNFLEHLESKNLLIETLKNAHRALKPGGKIVLVGPNIRYTNGAYWDFLDHHIPLTEKSLQEALTLVGFKVEHSVDRFLPYTMQDKREAPLFLIRLYLALPFIWRFFGQQFLVVARK